ncbi:hypothetical protein CKS_0615 [Pantoea stewartii subsp. stewartii DC283]|uniref:Uncharacterized protein n=1 Tax=Pantoea stewartii subsp. stewartii DC283 TaxID=660596 RepID=H3RA91_PANSE|nr:hypothetical protein CKS_0615 [Pantoea stewartii subsp. stewartii DC283]
MTLKNSELRYFLAVISFGRYGSVQGLF